MEVVRVEDREERCMCNCMTLKTAAMVIAAVEMVFLVYMLIYSIVIWNNAGRNHMDAFVVTVVFFVLGLVLIILLIMGVRGHKPVLIIPHLIAQVLGILLLYVMAIICIVALSGTEARNLQYIINVSRSNQDYYVRNRGRYDSYNSRGSGGYNNRRGYNNNYYSGDNDRRLAEELKGWVAWKMCLFLLMGSLEIWFLFLLIRMYREMRRNADMKKGYYQGQLQTPLQELYPPEQYRPSPGPEIYEMERPLQPATPQPTVEYYPPQRFTPQPQPVYTPQPIYTPQPQRIYTPEPQRIYTPQPIYKPEPQPIYTPQPIAETKIISHWEPKPTVFTEPKTTKPFHLMSPAEKAFMTRPTSPMPHLN